MDRHEPFIGIGHNPEGPDLPLGLGMQLAQEPAALTAFGRLTEPEKEAMVRYIQSCTTGEDAKMRIETAVGRLKQGDTGFFQ